MSDSRDLILCGVRIQFLPKLGCRRGPSLAQQRRFLFTLLQPWFWTITAREYPPNDPQPGLRSVTRGSDKRFQSAMARVSDLSSRDGLIRTKERSRVLLRR